VKLKEVLASPEAAGRLVSQVGQKRHDCDLPRSQGSSDAGRKNRFRHRDWNSEYGEEPERVV